MHDASSPFDGFFRAVLHCVFEKQKAERYAFVVWRQTANCHKLVSICRGFLSVFRVVKDVLVLEANSFSESQGSCFTALNSEAQRLHLESAGGCN